MLLLLNTFNSLCKLQRQIAHLNFKWSYLPLPENWNRMRQVVQAARFPHFLCPFIRCIVWIFHRLSYLNVSHWMCYWNGDLLGFHPCFWVWKKYSKGPENPPGKLLKPVVQNGSLNWLCKRLHLLCNKDLIIIKAAIKRYIESCE